MSRKLSLTLLLVFFALALLIISACTAEQKADDAVTNAINATADAASVKVDQFTGFAQGLVDQLIQEAKDPDAATAKGAEINYALDDINAALQTVIDAEEDSKYAALEDAQDTIDKAIKTIRGVADQAEVPDVQAKLNDIADGLEEIQRSLVDLINEQAQ